jgi:hypothetical protein
VLSGFLASGRIQKMQRSIADVVRSGGGIVDRAISRSLFRGLCAAS